MDRAVSWWSMGLVVCNALCSEAIWPLLLYGMVGRVWWSMVACEIFLKSAFYPSAFVLWLSTLCQLCVQTRGKRVVL